MGNVGANTASQSITIDTAAPTAPSITSIPENGGGGINASEASDGTPWWWGWAVPEQWRATR